MIALMSFTTPPDECGYLPTERWQMHYDIIAEASAVDYQDRLLTGWRHFGRAIFRPRCPACTKCQSIRVDVEHFQPDRSQRRNHKANDGQFQLVIGEPSVSEEKLDLYDRYHTFQTEHLGWPGHDPKDPDDYINSFVDSPFPIEEWCYYSNGRLVGVGYVDAVPAGLSAIYFYYEPKFRDRGLGTWNVLSNLAEARRRKVPHVYLGYYVAGCRSLEYKARFRPSEYFDWPTATWQPFTGPRVAAEPANS